VELKRQSHVKDEYGFFAGKRKREQSLLISLSNDREELQTRIRQIETSVDMLPNSVMICDTVRRGKTDVRDNAYEVVLSWKHPTTSESSHRWDLVFSIDKVEVYVQITSVGAFEDCETRWREVIRSITLQKEQVQEEVLGQKGQRGLSRNIKTVGIGTDPSLENEVPHQRRSQKILESGEVRLANSYDPEQKIRALLSRKASSLNRPVEEGEIELLQTSLGFLLPLEMVALYRVGNGQKSGTFPIFMEYYEYLTLEEIGNTYSELRETAEFLSEEMAEMEEPLRYEEEVSPLFWKDGWIPFARRSRGDLLCVDLTPGPLGAVGQIIEFIHDDVSRTVVAKNMIQFLLQQEEDSGT